MAARGDVRQADHRAGLGGPGLTSPLSNNAAIELRPGKIAAISGLRGMFRQTGGVLGTTLILLFLFARTKARGFG